MTTPCTQGPLLEIIVGKIDRVADKVDKISDSVHSIDLRVTKIETVQEVQQTYVHEKSKKNGQFWGALLGLAASLVILIIKEIITRFV